jgi:hypothetical protein
VICTVDVDRPVGVEGMAHAAAVKPTMAAAKPMTALRRSIAASEHDFRSRSGGGLNFIERPLEMCLGCSSARHDGNATALRQAAERMWLTISGACVEAMPSAICGCGFAESLS